jgi:hypothetical protein
MESSAQAAQRACPQGIRAVHPTAAEDPQAVQIMATEIFSKVFLGEISRDRRISSSSEDRGPEETEGVECPKRGDVERGEEDIAQSIELLRGDQDVVGEVISG